MTEVNPQESDGAGGADSDHSGIPDPDVTEQASGNAIRLKFPVPETRSCEILFAVDLYY